MLTWLRLIAERIMRRNGKPSRLYAAARMAMDAYFTPPSRSSRPPPPDAARHARGQAPMRRYTCPGFDPVEGAANAVEAAKFLPRAGRRERVRARWLYAPDEHPVSSLGWREDNLRRLRPLP